MKLNKPIVLISGTSGVGKTSLIKELCTISSDYHNIKSFTSRPLRGKFDDRQHISKTKFCKLVKRRRIILPNKVYGHLYGPSRKDILKTLSQNKIPISDWPVHMINDFKIHFPEIKIISIYLLPPSLIELKKRLIKDGRDKSNSRYYTALTELKKIQRGDYNPYIEAKFVNKKGILKNAIKLHSTICNLFQTKTTKKSKDKNGKN